MTLNIRGLEEIEQSKLGVREVDGSESKLSSLRGCTLVHLAWCPPVRDTVHPHSQQVGLLARLLSAYGESIDRVIAMGSAEEYGMALM